MSTRDSMWERLAEQIKAVKRKQRIDARDMKAQAVTAAASTDKLRLFDAAEIVSAWLTRIARR